MNRIPPAYLISCTGPDATAANPLRFTKLWGAADFAKQTGDLINQLADSGWPYIILMHPGGVIAGQVPASSWECISPDRQEQIAEVLIPAILRARANHPELRVGPLVGSFYDDLASVTTTKDGQQILLPGNTAAYIRNMCVWQQACNLEVYDFGASLYRDTRTYLLNHALNRAGPMGVEVWGESCVRPPSSFSGNDRDHYADGKLIPYVARPDMIDGAGLQDLDVTDRTYRFWFQGFKGAHVNIPDPAIFSAVQRQALVDGWAAKGWGFVCQNGQYGQEILRNWNGQ